MLDGKRCIGRALFRGRRARARPGPRARSWSAPARSTPRSCWSCRASASRSACETLGIEVRHALPGVGENLRDHYAPRTRWAIGAKGITYNDRGRGLGLVKQALRYALLGEGMLGMVARADPRLRPLARRPRGAGPAAGLGADADRARPEGAEDRPPVRHDLLRAPDAAGEQGAHPHRLGRSAHSRRRSTSISCRRRSMPSSPCAPSASPARS